VLLSETTRAIVAGDLPDGVELRSLGEQRLRDIDRPEPLHELRIDDVPVTPSDGAMEPELPAAVGLPPNLPGWLRGGMSVIGQRTNELIERRVLAELSDAFAEPGASGDVPRQTAPTTGSIAAEIARLRELRDAGALTDEQYARAVDRAIEGGG
jgi:hypothetical protein